MNRRNRVLSIALVGIVAAAGCESERLARLAEESTREQSAQNQRVSQAHASLAAGSQQLVEADANARRELAQLQDKLRHDQAEIGTQRDALERERQTLAAERKRESLYSSSLLTLGILLACLAPLLLAGIALATLNRCSTQPEVSDVLVDELAHYLDRNATASSVRLPASPSHSARLTGPASGTSQRPSG